MNRTSLLAVAVLACLCPIGYGEPRALSLEEALALSEDNAEALRIRELAVEKNRLRVNEARAKTLPRVTLEASGSYLANPPEGITVKAGELGSFTLPPPFNTL